MKSNDQFARELFEDAKCSLRDAKSSDNDLKRQRHLRHSLLAAFSFLELQIEIIAQHFKDSALLSLHERGMLNQQEVQFEKGVFRLKATPKYTRLVDRMMLLQSKFKGSKLSDRAWWGPLSEGTERRNAVAHPRSAVALSSAEVERDLLAVLACANDLFQIVFGKGLSYAALGTTPKSSG